MLSPERKRKLFFAGVFAVPIVLVKLSALLLGGAGPARAHASAPQPVELPPVQAIPTENAWTVEQKAAAAHLQELSDRPFGPAPLFYPSVTVTATDDPEAIIIEAPVEGQMPLRVTLIMKTSTGAVALVNGSPVRLGERIGLTHWRLTRITPEERSVEFSHDETGDVRIEALPGP